MFLNALCSSSLLFDDNFNQNIFSIHLFISFTRSGPKKAVTAEELDADLDAYNTNKVRLEQEHLLTILD